MSRNKSLYDLTEEKLRSLFNQGVQSVGNFANNIQQAPQRIGNQIENTVASVPYAMANYQRNTMIRNTIPLDFNKADQRDEDFFKRYDSAKPIQQLGMRMADDSFTSTANPSANFQNNFHNIAPPPKPDPRLEAARGQVLNNPNVRPQAREYLSKIPLSYENYENNRIQGRAYKDQSYGDRPRITISDNFKKNIPNLPIGTRFEDGSVVTQESIARKAEYREKELKTVIEHELLHQTPRLIPEDLYSPENLKQVDNYTNRWGKKYMKRPDALVEEMFAEQDLPPAYYWHIYKNTVQNPTSKGFINDMVIYFTKSQGRQGMEKPKGKPVKGGTAGRRS